MQCFGLVDEVDCFRNDDWGNNDSDDSFGDWDVETDGDGSCDNLLYTFKCVTLILFVTILFPSNFARV